MWNALLALKNAFCSSAANSGKIGFHQLAWRVYTQDVTAGCDEMFSILASGFLGFSTLSRP